MLLLYILWDDWQNEQPHKELEYILLKPDSHSWWISKIQSGREDTLEERDAIKLFFKLGKNITETYGVLQTAFRPSCMNLDWYKRFKEGRESVRDDERCERSKESIHQSWLAKGLGFGLISCGFKGVQEEVRSEEASTLQIGSVHFHQDNTPVHNSILITDYLSKMEIKAVLQPPYCRDFTPCDLCLFPRLSGCRYERVEEMKEAVAKVIDMLTQEDFHGALQKLLERYNKKITSKGTRVSCVYYQ